MFMFQRRGSCQSISLYNLMLVTCGWLLVYRARAKQSISKKRVEPRALSVALVVLALVQCDAVH